MRRIVILLAAALLLGAAWVPAAWADSTAPLTGAESICLAQEGTWHPNGFAGFEGHPSCSGVGIVVSQEPGSYARNRLAAANRLCKAAGFAGLVTFGKGIPTGGFFVVTWVCA
jgi:hypothetical protein